MKAAWWGAVFLLVLAPVARPVRADIFQLAQGGQLQGRWLNEKSGESDRYEIHTTLGIRLVLDRAMVREVVREPDLERQYQQEVARHGTDVEGHWAVAQWCREHGMKEQRRHHLQRILRLEPNHVGARLGLGYSQVRGNWVTQEESMRQQGYVLYRGRWQLPQQVELRESQRKREVGQRQWYRQLVQWRNDLATQRAERSSAALATIDDPLAVRGLATLIQSERMPQVRLLYVQALATIGTPEALHLLLDVALTDGDEDVVQKCLHHLAQVPDPSVLKRLLETLHHENNALVNRAALALARLPADDCVAPLIDALVTRHQVIVPGGEKDRAGRIIQVEVQNQGVLSALTQLTGVAGFGYDRKAWKQWKYWQNKQDHRREAQTADLRRTKS